MTEARAGKIIFITEDFLLGGIETYIIDLAKHLFFTHGIDSMLVANRIKTNSDLQIFSKRQEVNSDKLGPWIEAIANLAKDKDCILWAHHYRLYEGLIAAHKYGLRYVITLHSNLEGIGRLNPRRDALAASLVISNNGFCSVVSQEIKAQLYKAMPEREEIFLLPNLIFNSSKQNASAPAQKLPVKKPFTVNQQIRTCLLTRKQKVKHIEACLSLYQRLSKKGIAISLSIYSDFEHEPLPLKGRAIRKFLRFAETLGYRWAAKNVWRIRSFRNVFIMGITHDSLEVIRKHDMAMGMGRSALESLSLKKPCVLVGYTEPIGLITPKSFEDFQRCNFSGRECVPMSTSSGVESLIHELDTLTTDDIELLFEKSNIKNSKEYRHFLELLNKAPGWNETKLASRLRSVGLKCNLLQLENLIENHDLLTKEEASIYAFLSNCSLNSTQ